jgi:hypothetical protein
MTDDALDRILADWLQEGPERGRVEALERALAATRRTAQRPGWHRSWRPVRRFAQMNSYAKIAVAVAAVLVLAVAGFALLGRPANVAGPGPTATPSATPSPSPAVSLGAKPAQSFTGVALDRSRTGDTLDAGTYHVEAPFQAPLGLRLDIPWVFDDFHAGRLMFHVASTQKPGDPGASAAPQWFMVELIDNVYPDPCHTEKGPLAPPVAKTLDGVTAALTKMKGVHASEVKDTTVGYRPAKTFTLTNSVDTAACSDAPWLDAWTVAGEPAPRTMVNASTDQIWVVDVEGTVVLLHAMSFGNTPRESSREIIPLVGSITFD